jgi:hypothetical protein
LDETLVVIIIMLLPALWLVATAKWHLAIIT